MPAAHVPPDPAAYPRLLPEKGTTAMMYEYDDRDLSYAPGRGRWHFVLNIEPPGVVDSGLNAVQILEDSTSRYAAEWKSRLTPCDPDALHVLLAGSKDARMLWDPCVDDDPDSPSAIGRSGCVCWQTFRDPVTWLPVGANHYRTVSGNIEEWCYHTYAPLGLADDERLDRLIIDRAAHIFWIRTDAGTLHFLPEQQGQGYECGYSGGGPVDLARMIEAIVANDGYHVTPLPMNGPPPDDKVLAWVASAAANRTQELTLDQMKVLCRTGMVP
jgi:hypothetical protein